MRRLIAAFLFLSVIGAANSALAQNLLVNGNLELTSADVYFDGFDPSVADDVPGWNLFLGAADGSYVLVNGVGTGNVDVDTASGPAGGGMETASSSRPAVIPGVSYTASLTYDNYFAPAGAAYFIDWYDGGGSLISSDGGLLPDPNGPFGYEPYTQLLSVSGIASGSAATAGVRLTSGGPGYSGLAADNFRLVVPEPTSLAMFALASLVLFGGLRRRD